MSRKSKIDFETKIKSIEMYLNGEKGPMAICEMIGVGKTIFYEWIHKYKKYGAEGLKSSSKNTFYSNEVKMLAINDYISGKGSLEDIALKYNLSSRRSLQNWIMKYNNNHSINRSHNRREDKIMIKGRKTTYGERIEIVAFCIENNDNYQLTSDKYKVSYQQVYTWVKKYNENGCEALVDNRGKSKNTEAMSENKKLEVQIKLLKAQNKRLEMENAFLKKIGGSRKEARLTNIKKKTIYIAIKELNKEGYSILALCSFASISRSSYYKWLNKVETVVDKENVAILEEIIKIYNEVNGVYGYRRITMNVNRTLGKCYNHKRIYRLMKCVNLQSVIRKKRKKYIKSTPQITAENILNRKFIEASPNNKWLTDVTEFKLANGTKAYLSAILDLGDNSIVSYVLGHSNNNQLVFETFDLAIKNNPTAKPLFHSDRGFQYTNKVFKSKLDSISATQSMSRVGRCIDNGPMEGFWGIIKSEMYYLRKFNTFDELKLSIDNYIDFYNNKRLQKKLKGLAPIEYREQTLSA